MQKFGIAQKVRDVSAVKSRDLATRYVHNLEKLLNLSTGSIDLNLPVHRQSFFGKDGVYFCGFYISPTGMLREISKDAREISTDILKKQKGQASLSNHTRVTISTQIP